MSKKDYRDLDRPIEWANAPTPPKKLTAYEELKVWCEKHLAPEDYKIVPESRSYCATIYFAEFDYTDEVGMICFAPNGSVVNAGAMSADEMIEHIEDYERIEEGQKEKELPSYSPPPSSIGGMMVRKMIEEYERKQH